jgi:hypothetical protein
MTICVVTISGKQRGHADADHAGPRDETEQAEIDVTWQPGVEKRHCLIEAAERTAGHGEIGEIPVGDVGALQDADDHGEEYRQRAVGDGEGHG